MLTKAQVLSLFLPVLLLVSAQPGEAQPTGVRGVRGGGSTRVTGSMPGRSAAPSRSYSAPTRSYSAPSRSYSQPRSTPRASAPTRSYSRPSNGSSRSNYRAPLTRQTVPQPTRSNGAAYTPGSSGRGVTSYTRDGGRRVNGYSPGVTSYTRNGGRQVSPPSQNRTSTVVSGSAPGSYPGRIRPTAARVYTPNGSGVRGYAPGGSLGATNSTVRLPNGTTATRVMGVSPMRGNNGYRPPVVQPVNNGPVYVNNNYYVNRAPRYNNNCYDPYFYSNYNYRRANRFYAPCYSPFLSLGFFVARPYTYYDYARIDYAQPFVYGEESDYRSAPVMDNQVASTQPVAPVSLEQEMLAQISTYVESNSKDGRFQIVDPAFGNQVWSLDLTQAPAVYSLDANHYSVVTGFEGTLGENTIPSSVGLEFFVAREDGRWTVKDSWIVSANGIPRAKKFQSPTYPQVQTWQTGEKCPFSGLPMIPLDQGGTSRG